MTTRVYLVCFLALASITTCYAAYDPDGCYDNTAWTQKNDQFQGYTLTNISVCQMQSINATFNEYRKEWTVAPTNGFLMGAYGEKTSLGVKLGSGGDGVCNSATKCMRTCQALCCIANGCQSANVWSKKDDDTDSSGSGTTTWYYYCYTSTTPSSFKGSERYASCYTPSTSTGANGRPECPNIIDDSGFDWTEDYYNYLVSLKTTNTACPAWTGGNPFRGTENKRRKLLGGEEPPLPSNPAEIAAYIQAQINSAPITLGQIAAMQADANAQYGIFNDPMYASAVKNAVKRAKKIIPEYNDPVE